MTELIDMSETELNELLPCPFCGGKASMSQGASVALEEFDKGQYEYASCEKCGARTTNFFTWAYGTKTRSMAILAWNRRADDET